MLMIVLVILIIVFAVFSTVAEIMHYQIEQDYFPNGWRESRYLGQTQTNADRIRTMTDEELAAIIACPNEAGLAEIECDHSDNCNCGDCCLSWLRSPANANKC